MKDDNGKDRMVDQEKLKKAKEGEKVDITAEIIKLYQNDPISRRVIDYLLKKNGIILRNPMESIRLHREEILLNIVLIYKKMWDARGKIMLKAMQSSDYPVKIVIKERGNNGDNQEEKGKDRKKKTDGHNEGNSIKK